MKNNFVGLIVLDGYGLNKKSRGNAIKLANPVNIDYYFKNFPFTTLKASGESVGLPKGQIGNSEVGHMNIGAGKIVLQTLGDINHKIKTKEFFNNTALKNTINHVLKNNSDLHLIGLTSDGGVHSHISHLYALIEMAKQNGVKRLYVHVILDGRDTLRTAGITEVQKLKKYLKDYPGYSIATVSGRFYAMDREKDFARIKRSYDAMVLGKSNKKYSDPLIGIEESYNNQVFDEYVEPFVVTDSENNAANIKSNDGVVIFNFRADRGRQITQALFEDDFNEFERENLTNISATTFTRYDEKFNKPSVAFEKIMVPQNLSYAISQNGLKQFKITETTKYAHVTYFLNGGIEKPYLNEDRFLIETIKTDRFDLTPKMRAVEITDKAIELINKDYYNLMVLNYSNPDMIGHTGNLNAAIEAIKVLDTEVKRLVDAILKVGGTAVLVADHGNAEEMLDKKGNVLTDHTKNLVPFCIVSNHVRGIKLKKGGVLANIAPTVLDLLHLPNPIGFTMNSLIV